MGVEELKPVENDYLPTVSIAIFAFFFRYFSSTRPNEFFQIQAYLIHWFRLLALLFSLFAPGVEVARGDQKIDCAVGSAGGVRSRHSRAHCDGAQTRQWRRI
jgi:hypothetical protein